MSAAKRPDPEDDGAQQTWKADYDTQMKLVTDKHGKFKKYVIATDSEFGPEWLVRNDSQDTADIGGELEKVLYDDNGHLKIDHLKLKEHPSAERNIFYQTCREKSANKLLKKWKKSPQWYGSTGGPIWARLYSTVFWIYVTDDNGKAQTHRLVFPWYIYRSKHDTLDERANTFMNGDPPPNNNTDAERELLRQMARCWIDLIDNARYVIAWSSSGVDIMNPLDWFVQNDVFRVTADTRIRVLKKLGWNQEEDGMRGDMTLSSIKYKGKSKGVGGRKHAGGSKHVEDSSENDKRYVDLSQFLHKNLETAAEHYLERNKAVLNHRFKAIEPKQLDELFVLADNRTTPSDMQYCADCVEVDRLIFSRYDKMCAEHTGHSLLAYNDTDVSLMHRLLAGSKESLQPMFEKFSELKSFMYDQDGELKFQAPANENSLFFAPSNTMAMVKPLARSDAKASSESDAKASSESRPLLKRQNARVLEGPSEKIPGSSKQHPCVIDPAEKEAEGSQPAEEEAEESQPVEKKAKGGPDNPYVIRDE